MIGHIYINGIIGSYFDGTQEVNGVELIDVISQVQKQLNVERYLVHINSPGGLCSVGHAIYDYLCSLSVPVDTIAEQECASMGTVILMAGQNRIGITPLNFLAHNPWTNGIEGDYEDLQRASEEIKAEEDKIINIYHKVTGISKEGLDLLMKENKPMGAEKAYELGFLTAIQSSSAAPKQALKAVAILKSKPHNQMKSEDLDFIKKTLASIKGLFVKANLIKALMATTDQGINLEIWNPDMTEAGEIVPANLVFIDGAPAPDGSYTIPEYSVTINVLAGAIESVTPIEGNASPANMDDKIKELESKISGLEKENTELKAQVAETDKLLEDVKSLQEIVSKLKGGFEPVGSQRTIKKDPIDKSIKDLAKERQAVYNQKK